MNRRGLLAVVLILVAVGVAAAAYQAGVARGVVESGRLPAPAPGVPPYGYYGPYWHGPFGFGFFGFLFPLLFFFLIFVLLRGLFWGPRWGWHGPWRYGAPPSLEEWHRKAHESPQERGEKL